LYLPFHNSLFQTSKGFRRLEADKDTQREIKSVAMRV
jgi:hypothetical protein